MSRPPSTSMPTIPPLTLIVATTPSLGIGHRGSLPWPPLKSDLAFFARVTKRPPPPYTHPDTAGPGNGASKAINAVIMGRKTWDSIPSKVRPLKGRVNVVISRNAGLLESLGRLDGRVSTDTVGAENITTAIQALHNQYGSEDSPFKLGRVFVIGGASIYEQAMKMDSCERILWTRIHKEYECDVHFPGQGNLGNHDNASAPGLSMWEQRSRQALQEWCGDQSVGEVQTEGDTHFEVQMWERFGAQRSVIGTGSDEVIDQ